MSPEEGWAWRGTLRAASVSPEKGRGLTLRKPTRHLLEKLREKSQQQRAALGKRGHEAAAGRDVADRTDKQKQGVMLTEALKGGGSGCVEMEPTSRHRRAGGSRGLAAAEPCRRQKGFCLFPVEGGKLSAC